MFRSASAGEPHRFPIADACGGAMTRLRRCIPPTWIGEKRCGKSSDAPPLSMSGSWGASAFMPGIPFSRGRRDHLMRIIIFVSIVICQVHPPEELGQETAARVIRYPALH